MVKWIRFLEFKFYLELNYDKYLDWNLDEYLVEFKFLIKEKIKVFCGWEFVFKIFENFI